MKIEDFDPTGPSIYERAGGMDAFVSMVELFYDGVETDPVLRPIYPEDLEPGKLALAQFLAQYWGGPNTYSERKGHPRLRMRHNPFKVTPDGADRWAAHMAAAIVSMDFSEDVARAMLEYTTAFAPQMVNTLDD
ncbi:MAG: hemoglobin [Glaciecola sp.]